MRISVGLTLTAAMFLFALTSPALSDDCLQDAWEDGTATSQVLFPNWNMVKVTGLGVWLYLTGNSPENITGVTVVNYGTATDSDIENIYIQFYCGATNSGLLTLTYGGFFSEDAGWLRAWTWAGSTVNFSSCPDLCGNPWACGAYFNADIFVDIDPCPTPGSTIRLGVPTNGGFAQGGLSDNAGCQAPSGDAVGPIHTIEYVYKVGPDKAIPGDTVAFTLYYGRPGTSAISEIRIMDSLPPYTHYVANTANPPADAGWDPDAGPPMRMHWTLPGGNPGGGGTTMITFDLTVDWGNGEGFEPGSGDIAAPEGVRIGNEAAATYIGTNCPNISALSNRTETSVRRFLMWMMGDNDVLFAPTFGQPPDEMVYSVFVKNLSKQKTWWDVNIWDTVPDEIDVWSPGGGFLDPWLGWTMTPSGVAAAYPGYILAGTKTVLTWHLDMPPELTIELKWKGTVKPTTTPGDSAINVLSMQALGRTGIVDGTGDSVDPKNFAHIAPIILRTTYISYVSFGGSRWAQPDAGDALAFFPLNKQTQFELRGLTYVTTDGGSWAQVGGNSATIGCLLGDCLGGFPGSNAACPVSPIPSGAGSIAGCKAERSPARFHHAGPPLSDPYQHLYKLTANSPVCWQSQPGSGAQCGDYMTYAPATTLSYLGLLHYFWRNSYHPTYKGAGTGVFFMNTGKDPYGSVDTDLTTIVHLFKFDFGTRSWEYRVTYELGPESGACDPTTILGDEGAFRSVSSQVQLIVWQGYQALSTLGCGCPCYDNSTMMPTRENGNTVSQVDTGTFYGVIQGYGVDTKISLGNVGAVDATYKIYQYVPNTTAGRAEVPVNMRGTSGTWLFKGLDIVAAGFASALNPSLYAEDGTYFNASSTAAFRVELLSGGPIQIHSGARVFAGWGGGAVLHASVPAGSQTGSEFWVHQIHNNDGTDGANPQLYAISVFCPKTGMVVRMETDDARTETYTTDGVDQCITFIGFSEPGRKRNIRMTRLPAVGGDVIAQYMNAGPEKGYTAPFLVTGVHYELILPPVVFSGQEFWMTVIVAEAVGGTKDDYCGTTTFSSTDPVAEIDLTPMDSYSYTWSSDVAPCNAGNDNGVKVFVKVRLEAIGLQSIVARDTIDGSIMGIGVTMVVGVDVKLTKQPRYGVAASGDILQFKICWSNYSSGSATNFVITDEVPNGFSYVQDTAASHFCGATNGFGAATVAYSTTGNDPGDYSTMPGGGPATASWVRWTIPQIGVNTTGCVCFQAKVD